MTIKSFDEELARFDTEEELLLNGSGWVGLRARDCDPVTARAINSGDLLKTGRGAIVLPVGFTDPVTIEPLSTVPTIHANGVVVPALEDKVTHLTIRVRLVGWADFGREDTFYERFDDGSSRLVPEA